MNEVELEEKNRYESEETLELIKSCGEAEPSALKKFFNIYAQDIYNFPIKVFHLNEDSASDFFLYAFERLKTGRRFKSFRGRSTFRTWFYAVLRNLVLDWMRTLHELETVDVVKTGDNGQEYRLIENTPDPRSISDNQLQLDIIENFKSSILDMSIEQRVVFKLSFIYYLELTEDEIDFLGQRNSLSREETFSKISGLKNNLAEKELKNIGMEDKITSLYLAVIDMKVKKNKIVSNCEDNADLSDKERLELNRIDRLIKKKYQQRHKLLEKREKGHFIVRTPYKYVSELTGVPEGSISVQMMKIVENLKKISSDIEPRTEGE